MVRSSIQPKNKTTKRALGLEFVGDKEREGVDNIGGLHKIGRLGPLCQLWKACENIVLCFWTSYFLAILVDFLRLTFSQIIRVIIMLLLFVCFVHSNLKTDQSTSTQNGRFSSPPR